MYFPPRVLQLILCQAEASERPVVEQVLRADATRRALLEEEASLLREMDAAERREEGEGFDSDGDGGDGDGDGGEEGGEGGVWDDDMWAAKSKRCGIMTLFSLVSVGVACGGGLGFQPRTSSGAAREWRNCRGLWSFQCGRVQTRFRPRVANSTTAGGGRKEKGSCPAVFLFRETDFARTINTTSCCSRDRLAQVGAELDAIGADAAEGTVRKILTGLGFTDEMQVCTCCVVSWCGCGGKTKLSWACAVLDFLFCSGSQHSDSSGCCWVFSFAFPPETPSQANIFLVPNP